MNQNQLVQNELNLSYTEETLEILAERQDYLDYIDANTEAHYQYKTDQLNTTDL